ncbi:cytochrome P450 [Dendryphion nanum]|uniref:Cytochrome P450 n=1 Tax=Dendryphion nanum TaxID=256645 RepID=A0A9P9EK80_9PLEO|nr:cytochrome P450 [Dendryphion nanum]
MSTKTHPYLLYLLALLLTTYFVLTRLSLYLTRRRIKKQNNCQPCPYNYNKDPFLGLDVLHKNIQNSKAHKVLSRNLARMRSFPSPTFLSRIVIHPIIVTAEPENIKTMLSLKFKDYSIGNRQYAFTPLLGDGIFNSDGEKWANSRHLLRPNFAREQVADLSMLERHLRLMLKAIPKDGSTVDLQDLFFRMTMDTATEFLFNHSTSSLRMVGQDEENNEDAIFARAFNYAQADALTKMRIGSFFDRLRQNKEGKDAIKICHAYVDKWVDEAIRYRSTKDAELKASGQSDSDAKEERYVFIHELAKQTKDKVRIRNELINVLLAGRDTTASLLSNMFFQFGKHPEIWKKLRQEIDGLEGRIPTYEELRGLKYLKYCMNESLRLHPVVPGNSRQAIRDTVLPVGGGPTGSSPLFVPAGTMVAYTMYSVHRRTDLYGPDVEEYRPERWETLRPGWEYLPFNGGPRICLGQQYALTEASYVTVRIVQEFGELEGRDPGPWEESLTLTCCSRNGTRVGLWKRGVGE